MAANPLNVVVVCQEVPFLLYSIVLPNGDVTSIIPVAVVQVGSVMVARGAAGAPGIPFIVKFAEDMHVGFVVVRTRIV